jgi:hypothetical protein
MENTTDRFEPSPSPEVLEAPPTEEALVDDDRAGLTPAEMVERKLVSLLNRKGLPVSHLNTPRRHRPQP